MDSNSLQRPIRRLASPLSALAAHYDAIVIGSGYGASIAASRLARARRADGSALTVCVLERGEELHPGEYPSTPVQAAEAMQCDMPEGRIGRRTGLYDLRVNEDLNAFVGCGLGGGSLVNANVSLEADPRVLADPAWPAAFRADVEGLTEAYRRARDMLKPTPYPNARNPVAKFATLDAMGQGDGIGKAADTPPINVHFGAAGRNHVGVVQLPCTGCGDCVSGCNVSAKNTLLMNYLPDAANHGAKIFCSIGVRSIAHGADGKWKVFFHILESGNERFDAPESFVTADRVFVGAGALGSTEILLRSKARGLPLSDKLGQRFTGNGDVLSLVYNAGRVSHPLGFGLHPPSDNRQVGPCITGVLDLRATNPFGAGMVIEEGSIPSPLAPVIPAVLSASAAVAGKPPAARLRPDRLLRETESLVLGGYQGAVDRSQVLLVMSHDDGAGEMALDDDRLRIRWPGLASQPTFVRVEARLAAGAKAIDGVLVDNPISTDLLGRRLITVHALGGCAMGESAAEGVVDERCRVFDPQGGTVHRGLYVCDGAAIPRPLGVNPLLTISAVAERALALAAVDEGWTLDVRLPSAPPIAAGAALDLPVGIQFTETMRGFVSADADVDHAEAATRGKAADTPFEFTLVVRSDDLDAMLGDPMHRASLAGTVRCPMLSAEPLAVSDGEFQLLPIDPAVKLTRRMRYRFAMTSVEGPSWRFDGVKTIHDDPGLDLWSDTTTLAIDISRDGAAVARGELKILPKDFAIQMTTLRALHAPNLAAALAAKARFGRFFAGALADTYLGLAHDTPNVWPPGASEPSLRARRPLRLPEPEVYTVRTTDGVDLRLTRYRGGTHGGADGGIDGGTKGPVMLAHGLGVSSRIFMADTIDTSLAEFLVAAGYDTWMLDFRASVDLPASRGEFSGDDVARFDYPAAVERIRAITGRDTVQIVAHCFGASTLFMALAAGLGNVRSAVFSQIAGHVSAPFANQLRAALYLPNFLRGVGIDALTTDLSAHPDLLERMYDIALTMNPAIRFDQHCRSKPCHRISFLYAPLYRHEQLNAATHEAIGELFGVANLRSLAHLAKTIREKKVVSADGRDDYLPDDPVQLGERLAGFRFPIRFIHGALNECFLPESTERSLDLLRRTHPDIPYDRVMIPGYGHIDCIFGMNAARDVFPHIVAHLDATA